MALLFAQSGVTEPSLHLEDFDWCDGWPSSSASASYAYDGNGSVGEDEGGGGGGGAPPQYSPHKSLPPAGSFFGSKIIRNT